MSKDTRGEEVKAVQQKSKVELLFIPCGFPKSEQKERKLFLEDKNQTEQICDSKGDKEVESISHTKDKLLKCDVFSSVC